MRQIAWAVRWGELIRVRRGHYALVGMSEPLLRAVRVGGRLACVSALRERGVWVLGDERLHVQVAPNAARLRDPDDRHARLGSDADVRVHWCASVDVAGRSPSRVSVPEAIVQASICLPPLALRASVDSALNHGLLSHGQLAWVRRTVPIARAEALGRGEKLADSGLESIARELLRALGLRVTTQARFDGVGRVDLLVEDWLVIECDGNEYHWDAAPIDRRRDAALQRAGRTALRFDYPQLVFGLENFAETVIVALETHGRINGRAERARVARRRLAPALRRLNATVG